MSAWELRKGVLTGARKKNDRDQRGQGRGEDAQVGAPSKRGDRDSHEERKE